MRVLVGRSPRRTLSTQSMVAEGLVRGGWVGPVACEMHARASGRGCLLARFFSLAALPTLSAFSIGTPAHFFFRPAAPAMSDVLAAIAALPDPILRDKATRSVASIARTLDIFG